LSRPFLKRKVVTRASTIQRSDGPELRVRRYSQCFPSRHEDPSASHPATPERRISISHTLTDAPRPITFIRLSLSQLFYHGAPVPATSSPSMPNVRAARCPTDRLSGEPQWQRRSSVLCLHKRPAPSYVHDLGRQPRHRQWEPTMLVQLHESQDHDERTRPDRFLFLRCGRMRIF
jgi:hypothetical protein